MPVEDSPRDVTRALEDAAYVAVGFAVLGIQKAQVRRRALFEQLGRLGGMLGDAVATMVSDPSPATAPGAHDEAGAPGATAPDGPADAPPGGEQGLS